MRRPRHLHGSHPFPLLAHLQLSSSDRSRFCSFDGKNQLGSCSLKGLRGFLCTARLSVSEHQHWSTSSGNASQLRLCTWVDLIGPRSVRRYFPWVDSPDRTSPNSCGASWPTPHVHGRKAADWRRGFPGPNRVFQSHGQWPNARIGRCQPPCHGRPYISCRAAPAAHSSPR